MTTEEYFSPDCPRCSGATFRRTEWNAPAVESQIVEKYRSQAPFAISHCRTCGIDYVFHLDEEGESGNVIGEESLQQTIEAAASEGSAEDQLMLGRILWMGDGVEPDQRGALHWWTRAADENRLGAAAYHIGLVIGDPAFPYRRPRLWQQYAWFIWAHALGDGDAGQPMAQIQQQLSYTDRRLGEGMARGWDENGLAFSGYLKDPQ